MPKNKDPAVLFYPSDFLSSTILWSDAEIGMYIKLLCLQFLQDGVSEDDLNTVCGENKRVRGKFPICADGLYRNPRMSEEKYKRTKFSESRRNNINKRYNKNHTNNICDTSVEHMNNICNTSAVHMENENENKNTDIDSNSNNSFSFSNTTTTTTTICDSAQVREAEIVYKSADGDITADMLAEMRRDNALRKEIEDYFYANGYISNPELFISYNAGRGWRGHNSIDIRENGAWMKYADEWENKERRKANGGYIG